MKILLLVLLMTVGASAQFPKIEPGVPHDLAKWRAVQYSDLRYKLDLTLEKMSPVLKGTIEIRVNVSGAAGSTPVILDWRKIKGSEGLSIISNVSLNGAAVSPEEPAMRTGVSALQPNVSVNNVAASPEEPAMRTGVSALRMRTGVDARRMRTGVDGLRFEESDEHLIFREGVRAGENVIRLDFTSPISTSGAAVTRYVDKEDGGEYLYSLFVPSDASTAFPVFDQPDLKARFSLRVNAPADWKVVSNTQAKLFEVYDGQGARNAKVVSRPVTFEETKPISTYVFAFAAGPWEQFADKTAATATAGDTDGAGEPATHIYVRRSQAKKFEKEAPEVFRLTREGLAYLESYFDYKFPFPKYDLVLIPEFPFGGMEHAGATFLREDRIIFPQEPTKNDYITRANVIFHEAAHQWFGDTVTMKWFDDLWLKEGFAEFMAYKTLEKVMPEYNAWKIFYERNKQAAYATDSTKGTTPIYQQIDNLSAAKSAYGNIVYRKAPSFLRQAEFYLGEDKFQTAVRAFLKKHEFANAGWEDLVKEFEAASGQDLQEWAKQWVTQPGVPIVKTFRGQKFNEYCWGQEAGRNDWRLWSMNVELYFEFTDNSIERETGSFPKLGKIAWGCKHFWEDTNPKTLTFAFPNYQDHGYGIFLLDRQSRDYVLKNIQNEKDDFLRTMMWGALWDSVREGELDPKEYVELVVKNLSAATVENHPVGEAPTPRSSRKGGSLREERTTPSAEAAATPPKTGGELKTSPLVRKEGSFKSVAPVRGGESDESTIATLLGRVSTAMNYYLSDTERTELAPKVETMLMDNIEKAPTLGQRITFYRAFLNIASTQQAKDLLKRMLNKSEPGTIVTGSNAAKRNPVAAAPGSDLVISLKTKDRFDIVTRLLILGDPEAPKLFADLEKKETSDEAKRYAYAAKAGIANAENKEKYWNDFINNKSISESWIESAMGPFNSVRQSDLTLPYLERALAELPSLKRNRKIFFVNGWLGAFTGGQRSEKALAIVNKFLADNPDLDRDLRLKILENVDVIERAVKIRAKYAKN